MKSSIALVFLGYIALAIAYPTHNGKVPCNEFVIYSVRYKLDV